MVVAGAFERLFERFDRTLRNEGWLAMGGQIVDATVNPESKSEISLRATIARYRPQ
jgi:transposase, IS5 family